MTGRGPAGTEFDPPPIGTRSAVAPDAQGHRGPGPGWAAGDRRIVLATRNPGKVVELREILRGVLTQLDAYLVGVEEFPLVADVVETGVTFEENAVLKARTVAFQTGLPAVADDSGLAVDVLGGAPGVFSARWSGFHGDDEANLRLLLRQLHDVPEQQRAAAFVCCAALVLPDGRAVTRHGRFEGSLTFAPRGTNGFGYDPILRVRGRHETAAELSPADKNAISHRGKAFRALAEVMPRALGLG
ncbi:XTP/dITP diphosphohydrolase [Kineosphaera limosa]|uniref:dITP/XTP pyrophosphatase n=1 Tax=Kineosphaera limosa NBRC 100340 TaxID=1184609 RepID=K6XFY6_9MICO|nr:RdgB/HAM1 family non-canonical purine NTP pyrophosphatase [Kineosphaera limosa]NYE02659.1 XTP/dITP diphosphohydrolase [Kineosphaera limosa]GAB97749.1 non-canonical purine NTP pyrophosphatase [Kineosphaera limosa NBRC 100340]